ncbi:MAG: hypothetical protein EZS28_002190 [Streblomastix strix]|uniref:B30.2/SPRY domain-containing protein n=1 Tax=Streblomastix strix TaxID=222440 RepID=A0A5J4X4W3_9EUKA|nr:MAG: hypothetical protein EZS28_002190 [Streblomastix strix]
MEDSSLRAGIQIAFTNQTDFERIGNIPQIAFDLRSSDTNLHVPALQQLLITVAKIPSCLEAVQQQDIIGILKNFLVSGAQTELQELSSGILGIIGVRWSRRSKKNRASSSANVLLQIILSSDEKLSRDASDALCKLIGADEQIRQVLFMKRFIYLILESLSIQSPEQMKSSSSDQEEELTQDFVKAGLLAVILKLVEDEEQLNELSVLIPVLEELKKNGKGEVKSKARTLLNIFSGAEISVQTSQKKDDGKDIRIKELEESNQRKDELIRQNDEQIRQKDDELMQKKDEKEKISKELFKERSEKERLIQENRSKDERIAELERQLASTSQQKPEIKSQFSIQQLPGDIPISITIPIEYSKQYTKKEGEFTYTSKNGECKTFPIDQIITNGLYRCEFKVNKAGSSFGIMKSGLIIPFGKGCGWGPYGKDNACYSQKSNIGGNQELKDGDIVAIEVIMTAPRTATFFINGKQQPVYISNIPESVQFFFTLSQNNTSTTVLSLKRLEASTSTNIAGATKVIWA